VSRGPESVACRPVATRGSGGAFGCGGGRRQGQAQDVGIVVHEMEGQLAPDVLGYVLHVARVVARQDDRAQPGAVRGQHLILDAAPPRRQHQTRLAEWSWSWPR